MKNRRVFVDVRTLVPMNPSGIAHYVSNILTNLDAQLDSELEGSSSSKIDYYLIVPFRSKTRLEMHYDFSQLTFKPIYLRFRVMNYLVRKRLLPLDLFFGRGTYIFPDFVRSPLFYSKSIVFIYDIAFRLYPHTVEQKTRKLLENKIHDSMQADKIFTISHHTSNELIKLDSKIKDKIKIIQPSVDLSLFYRRSNDEIIRLKNKLNVSGAYILAVGNLEPRKNIVNLIKAYAKLSSELSSRFTLLIIGAGSWQSSETIDLIKKYQTKGLKIKVILGGIQDSDMPALYSGATIFVFPSLYEGYGIPPIEAMACGTPVISSQNSAIREAVGDAALLLNNEKEPRDIADKITTLLKDENMRTTMQQKGYKHIDMAQTWYESAEIFRREIESLQEEL